eukprot:5992683-Pleurochrysis_carterae.AAC.1
MPPSHARLTLSGARCAGRPAPVCRVCLPYALPSWFMPPGSACLGSRCPAELRPPGTCPSPR